MKNIKKLINLEKEIYFFSIDVLKQGQNTDDKEIKMYSTKKNSKGIFNNLIKDIDKISERFKGKYEFCPFSSIAQFLGCDESDIVIYMKLHKLEGIRQKNDFIYSIVNKFPNSKTKPKINISTRLCVINLNYKWKKIDLSLLSFCPYIHRKLVPLTK